MTLLEDLQQRLGVSYLFIGHDLATVTHISHRIAVMYLGKIVEIGESQDLRSIRAIRTPRRCSRRRCHRSPTIARAPIVTGEVPSALNPPPAADSIRAARRDAALLRG